MFRAEFAICKNSVSVTWSVFTLELTDSLSLCELICADQDTTRDFLSAMFVLRL